MSFAQYAIFDIPEGDLLQEIAISRDVVIFVPESDFSDADRQLLGKILGAANKDIAQSQIVSVGADQTCRIKNHQPIEAPLLLSFGISSDQLGMQLDKRYYQLKKLDDLTMLFASTLSNIANSKEEKSALWGALKTFYKI